jgi:hypothetical protein
MNAAKTDLSPTEAEKIKAGLKQCILTLDHSSHALGDAELRLRKQLVQLHAEIEKIAIDSQHPFAPES